MTRQTPQRSDFCHPRPAALSLDAAGTLLDVAAPVDRTYADVAARFGIDVDAATVRRRFATAFGAAPPLTFGPSVAADARALERQERKWWRAIVGECLGLAADDPRLDPCFDALFLYYARDDAWRLYVDVLPALEALREAGVPVVVLSNFDSRLLRIADGLGLNGYARAVICSTVVGHAKPAAPAFAAAATALGVPAGKVLHVGDSRRADVDGARAAGSHALLLDRAGEPGPGVISSLAALTPALFGR